MADRNEVCTRVPIMGQSDERVAADCSKDNASRRLYDDVAAGTAQVTSDRGKGSGFLVRTGDEIVTNLHVVGGSKHVTVTTADGEFAAEIERVDEINDLALLKVIGSKPVKAKALQLGSSDGLKDGAPVFGVGHPLGRPDIWLSPGSYTGNEELWLAALGATDPKEAASYTASFNALMGASLDKSNADLSANATAFLYSRRLETTMHTDHGSSGSAVVDAGGKVIGVDDVLLPTITFGGHKEARSGAIPVEKVKALLDGPDPKFDFVYKTEAYFGHSPNVGALSKFAKDYDLPVQWMFSPWAEERPYLAEVKRKDGSQRLPLGWNGWDKP